MAIDIPQILLGQGGNIIQDGRCNDQAWAGALSTDLGQGVTLLSMHDHDRVYLCVIPPMGSLGTMDLFIKAAADPIVDLHISAQVGERTAAEFGWPDYNWYNFIDWYGTPVPFNGLKEADDGKTRPQFQGDTSREIVIEKRKFAASRWRVRFEVRALGPDRKGRVVFPSNTGDLDPNGWAVLDTYRSAPQD